jgi:hypothetical protein
MNKSLRQLLEEAKTLQLSTGEKNAMRQELRAFIHGDVRKPELARHNQRSMVEVFKLTFIKPMPILIAILIALGGGTSFAAQQSLPGDALYSVKVHVNEEVKSLLAMSPEAKAEVEADLAAERLEEAEKLAARGELDAQVRAHLEENFQEHADKVQDRIEKMSDLGIAADVATRFQASLKAHERILADVGFAQNASSSLEWRTLLIKIKAESHDSDEDRNQAEGKVKTSPNIQAAAEGRLNAAQHKIDEVAKFLSKTNLDAAAVAQAQVRLNAARGLVVQGQTQLTAKAYAQAFTLFGQALSTAQEAKLLIEAKDHFEHEDNDRPSPSKTSSPSVSPSGRSSGHVEVDEEDEHSGGRSSGKVKIDLEL